MLLLFVLRAAAVGGGGAESEAGGGAQSDDFLGERKRMGRGKAARNWRIAAVLPWRKRGRMHSQTKRGAWIKEVNCESAKMGNFGCGFQKNMAKSSSPLHSWTTKW